MNDADVTSHILDNSSRITYIRMSSFETQVYLTGEIYNYLM